MPVNGTMTASPLQQEGKVTYIAFLRAVNVGGRVVKMERLRELFAQLGCTGVRSYIQTGNLFFETEETDREALTSQIEAHLLAALGYDVATFLRTIPEVERSLALDPFKEVEVRPDTRLHVIFTSQPLPSDLALPLLSPKGDCELVQATPGEVFVVARQPPGQATNLTAFIEKTFKIRATARSFTTTIKILAAARQA
jgi:uncharacterized protein (DUF1697 family)